MIQQRREAGGKETCRDQIKKGSVKEEVREVRGASVTIMNTGGLLGVRRSGGKWRSWGDSKLIRIFQVIGVDCYYSKRCALALPPGGHCPEDATFRDLVSCFVGILRLTASRGSLRVDHAA